MIAVSSWVVIPISAIPVTLQTFTVCAVAALLGAKWGFVSAFVYILLGVAGLPVFSGFGGGIGVLLGATGGYIISFLFIAFFVGYVSDRSNGRFLPLLLSMAGGILVCYIFGSIWFAMIYSDISGFAAAFLTCVAPYILPDSVKIVAAALVASRLRRFLIK